MCVRPNCFPFSALPLEIFSISISLCGILNNFFMSSSSQILSWTLNYLFNSSIVFFLISRKLFCFSESLNQTCPFDPSLSFISVNISSMHIFLHLIKYLMSLEALFFWFMSLTYKELFLPLEKNIFSFPVLFFFNWSTVDLTHILIDISGCAFATYMCVSSCIWVFTTPWTVVRQAPQFLISYARILEWVAISFSRKNNFFIFKNCELILGWSRLVDLLLDLGWEGFPPASIVPATRNHVTDMKIL